MRRSTVEVTLKLTYDGWRDLEGALLARAVSAGEAHHTHMRDRLNDIRHDIEEQVRAQRPRWRT